MTSDIALIARREVVTRLQQRGYRIGFAVALLVVIAVCVLPSLFSGGDDQTSYDIGVTSSAGALDPALTAVAKSSGVTVHVRRVGAGTAAAQVRSGDLDAALLPNGRLVVQDSSDAVVGIVQQADQLAATTARLRAAGLSSAEARRALDVPPLRVTSTSSPESDQRQAIATVTVIVLFSQMITFVTWVATGVVEEKASRVVELILATVRPVRLLTGKLVGIGTLAAAQVLALGVAALVAGNASGTITVPASALSTVVVAFVGFLLGYAFFASLAAALASTVSRQEEVSGVLTPVTLTITACYLASFAATSSTGGTLARVLSIVPPVSSFAMPARIAGGGVPVLDIVLAVVLLVAASAAVIALAGRVYRASVLHTGTRVPLQRAFRGEAVGG